jgi:tripartite-type tricarboxylate transporter receptor subunit TctC
MSSNRVQTRRSFNFSVGAALALSTLRFEARAQDFPSRTIRIVVPFAAGGPTDLMARTIAKSVSTSVGKAVITDNRPGGGGVIGMNEIMRSPADGYTLVLPSIIAVTNPALMPDYPFDTLRDFVPLTVVGFIPHAVVVPADYPAKTLQDLVALAKAKPDTLSYGSTGVGTSAHLGAAMFVQRAGIKVTHVPYRGSSPAMQDLLAGRIQFMFLDMSTALPQIRSGRLRALAVAPANRFAGLPDVPTVAEQGYPGFDVHCWYGLLLKSGTPAPAVDKLYSEIKKALDTKEVDDIFRAQGIEPGGMSPTEFAALVRNDLALWKQTIAQLHITL